ncbi:prefoldin subunit beta [Candidatus Micrarchaeota archaeon]|nr:prefoldin subunit beta [Candidatus Micrarchaeota archaeon]
MVKRDEDLNRSLMEYENMEKQLEVLLIQKHQLEIQRSEIRHAVDALKGATGDVYRSVGTVLIHTTKDTAEKDLKEKEELLEVKVNALAKQEERLRSTVMDQQKKLQERLKDYSKPS